jgi:hypothetical protein
MEPVIEICKRCKKEIIKNKSHICKEQLALRKWLKSKSK